MLVSLAIPVYNEEKNISRLYEKLMGVFAPLRATYQFEILFVDDGSSDGTAAELLKLSLADDAVKTLTFSRNFGKEAATTAGIHHAKGDAVIIMDADLQHPPELIPFFLEKWEGGADVVVGIRDNDADGRFLRRWGGRVFNAAMKRIGDATFISHATDFRLISRAVADEFNKFTEHQRITRGLIDWLGFTREVVHFTALTREDHEPRYGIMKLTKLALSSFVSHSLFPLRVTGYLGIMVTFVSGVLGAFIFFEKYVFADAWRMAFSGSAILAVAIVFLVGIILSCLGLIALYIANIHEEMANRPMYVIRKKNF